MVLAAMDCLNERWGRVVALASVRSIDRRQEKGVVRIPNGAPTDNLPGIVDGEGGLQH